MVDQQLRTKTTLVIASILYSHYRRFQPLDQGFQPMDTCFLPLDQGLRTMDQGFQPMDQYFLRTSSTKKAQNQNGFHYYTMECRGAFVITPFFTARLYRSSSIVIYHHS